MFIAFLHFLAQLIIALTLLRVIEVKLLQRDPDSVLAKALAFVV